MTNFYFNKQMLLNWSHSDYS